jgi:hypothetical protein
MSFKQMRERARESERARERESNLEVINVVVGVQIDGLGFLLD